MEKVCISEGKREHDGKPVGWKSWMVEQTDDGEFEEKLNWLDTVKLYFRNWIEWSETLYH